MKCAYVQKALAAFVEGELASTDRLLIQQHLAACAACRAELGQLTGQALQRLAAEVEPSPQAWSRLQTRLAKEAQPSPGRLSPWLSRLAPSGGSTPTHSLGDNTMRNRIWLPALAAAIAVVLAVLSLSQNVPAVSAQHILDRAVAAQSAVKAAPGINHIRTESYYNFEALAGDSPGTRTIIDSYFDYQTANMRNVTTDADTGKVLDAFAYNGHITYSTKGPLASTASEPLTIYRTPQSLGGGAIADAGGIDFEQLFAELRADPQVTVEGQQTWFDGRSVYVLSTQLRGKYLKDPNGVQTKRMFFDAGTYQPVGERATIQIAGQEVVIAEVHYLVNETLPAATPVAWDLSDLPGVNFVDDVDRTQGDLLPEKITVQELAAHTRTGYLLKTIPAGFNLEIEAPPKQDNETSYIYIASYRTEAGDYFVIQASGAPILLPEDTAEVYTTAAGLVVSFMQVEPANMTDGKQYQFATVKAPDGTAFMISSTLPRERVKTLAEELIVVQ